MRTRWHAAPFAALLLLSGCGSEGGFPAAVCGRLDRWVQAVNGSLDELGAGAEDRASAAEERRAVGDHLDDVAAANARLVEELRATSADPGAQEELIDRLEALLVDADRAVSAIRDRVRDAPGDVVAFRDLIGPLLGERLGGIIRRLLAAPVQDGGDLAAAFEDEPACDGVVLEDAPQGGTA